MEIWAIEPPKKLKIKIYRCDQTFVTDPLKEMLETDEVYGLLIIERNEDGKLFRRHPDDIKRYEGEISGRKRLRHLSEEEEINLWHMITDGVDSSNDNSYYESDSHIGFSRCDDDITGDTSVNDDTGNIPDQIIPRRSQRIRYENSRYKDYVTGDGK